jgi:hypothetical protein
MRRAAAAIAALAAGLGAAAEAPAEDARDRKVAVLEVRSGSTAAPQLGARLAQQLGRSTSLAVLSPDAARQAYGDKLDDDASRCVGQAGCIARIAHRLEVDEILLVGISELGDIIVTLQRIRGDGEVAGRVAEAMPAGAMPGARDLDRFLRRVFPESDFERYGTIRVEANIKGAAVYVGEKKIGTTPLAPVQVLAPADYQVTVSKSGYSPFRAAIEVGPDSVVKVEPELVMLQRDAWYKKWWVLAIAGGVTAAATVGAVILVTRDGGDVPVMVEPF